MNNDKKTGDVGDMTARPAGRTVELYACDRAGCHDKVLHVHTE